MQELYGRTARPVELMIYGTSDYATMEPKKGKKEPDYTEHGIWGMDHLGDIWALDWWYKQCETDVGISAFITLVQRWRPVRWFNEGGLIDKAIGPSIRDAMRSNQAFVTTDELPLLMDKGVKLQAFHARATAGTVHFPLNEWGERVVTQLVKFPGGRFDDAADNCGLIGRGVDKMTHAQNPVVHQRPILVPFSPEWLEYNEHMRDTPKVRYW